MASSSNKPSANGIGSNATGNLAARLREVSRQLELLSLSAEDLPESRLSPQDPKRLSDRQLHKVCCKIYDARRRREEFFSSGLFSEPAWDILLDIFKHETDGGALSVKQTCIGSNVAATTALRYIRLLESEGLVTIAGDERDRRGKKIKMSSKGFRKMREYLISGLGRENLPYPSGTH